ncbi:hypothetical protein F750_2854 [Streptomyces sp. PAMC 26508]|nr:hypothetical protein F750_2854 [Streptomyces sp. PAMC 26508]
MAVAAAGPRLGREGRYGTVHHRRSVTLLGRGRSRLPVRPAG